MLRSEPIFDQMQSPMIHYLAKCCRIQHGSSKPMQMWAMPKQSAFPTNANEYRVRKQTVADLITLSFPHLYAWSETVKRGMPPNKLRLL
jgi:hypothetical protein